MNAIWTPAAKGNYRVGRTAPITQITFHHIVGDAQAAITRFQTPGVEVSSTYVIGSDGRLYQTVKETDTPYTDGNAQSNARSITIEHAGGHSSVGYTEAMYRTAIALVKDITTRYKITRFERHRDVSDNPTVCPGNLDVERIIKEATKGGDMPITEEALYMLIRGIGRREPTLAEMQNRNYYDNPELAIRTFWNNGGADLYYKTPQPVDSQAAAKLEQIKQIVNQ